MSPYRLVFAACCLLASAVPPARADAGPLSPDLYAGLRWRMIGPFRGGRTVGAAGVPGRPNVFYVGVNNGGVWKTTDAGRTWRPIFDDQPTGSVGALAVAPSNPDILYVGSGEGLQRPDLSVGDGVYKSTDGGKTWKNMGLKKTFQIGRIAIHPKNLDIVYVAALGRLWGPNAERGLFKTTDGGHTWQKILYVDDKTGALEVKLHPNDPDTLLVATWDRERDGFDSYRGEPKPPCALSKPAVSASIAPSDSSRFSSISATPGVRASACFTRSATASACLRIPLGSLVQMSWAVFRMLLKPL